MASQGWWLRCGSSQVEVGMCVVWNVFGCVMGMIKGKGMCCVSVMGMIKGKGMCCVSVPRFLGLLRVKLWNVWIN